MPRTAKKFLSAQREAPLSEMHNNGEVLQQAKKKINNKKSKQEVLDSFTPFVKNESEKAWEKNAAIADKVDKEIRKEFEENSLYGTMKKSTYAGIFNDLKNQPEVLDLITRGQNEEAALMAAKYAEKQGFTDPIFQMRTYYTVKNMNGSKAQQLMDSAKKQDDQQRVNELIAQASKQQETVEPVKEESLSDKVKQSSDNIEIDTANKLDEINEQITDLQKDIEYYQNLLARKEIKKKEFNEQISKIESDINELEEQKKTIKINSEVKKTEAENKLYGEYNKKEGIGSEFYSVEKGAEPNEQLDNAEQYDPKTRGKMATDAPTDPRLINSFNAGYNQAGLDNKKLKSALDFLTEKFNNRDIAVKVLAATTGISVTALTYMLLTGDNSDG